MNTYRDLQLQEIAELDLKLLARALKALRVLTYAADSDIYTDAPECQASVDQAQEAVQAAYIVLGEIRKAVEPPPIEEPVEVLAHRILDEADEAFAARKVAEERAAKGRFPRPVSIPDYLFWIEDELRLQGIYRLNQPQEQTQQRIYLQALFELTRELRWLG
ncbi:MAG TPA: hypothetical protein VN363_03325, partial [Anaerolineales bacterium]|nr:hypothetical protein [Anaerolineales bacterium]